MATYLSPGVYVEELEAGSRPIEGVGTAVAAFLGFADDGPFNQPTLVTNWTQFVNVFGDFTDHGYLHHAVYGYFQNGGGAAYVVRLGANGASGASGARAELTSATSAGTPTYEITAKAEGTGGERLTVEVSDPSGDDPADDAFTIVVKRGGTVEETFENVTARKGPRNVVDVIVAESQLIEIVEVGRGPVAERRPATGSVDLSRGAGATPVPVAPDDFVGNSADRTGFGGLEAIDGITMVCAPDVMAAHETGQLNGDQVKAIQLAMIAHCELMADRMAIIDPPPGLNAQQVQDWRIDGAGYDSKFAALYWPWITVADPVSGNNIPIPPSGHMAGIWGRNDTTRGVHKAPANEVIRGAVDLAVRITRAEQDLLNPHGINALRSFPGRGIRVWGSRTLSSDPAWRYVPVRRLFNYLETSILAGTNWVVFEPNDEDLWGRIRRTISAFLYREWLSGSLFGATPDEAYYVKCDAETNPSEVIEAGQVVCEIGVAPVKPAEFVIFRIAQLPSGSSSVSE